MIAYETKIIRGLIFILGVVLIGTSYLVIRVNPGDVGLMYMALLVTVVVVGLLANLWGGLLASVVASFAIIAIDQYVGIYPRENTILNIASELIGFMLVGPLAGGIGLLLQKIHSANEHWLRVAEGRAIHDGSFGTLKPKWLTYRVEEEMLRARKFNRPLAIGVLDIECLAEETKNERSAVLEALIRISQAATQPPSVVTYIGDDQLLLVLPEHDPAAAQRVVDEVQKKFAEGMYHPHTRGRINGNALGKPLSTGVCLQARVVTMNGQASAVELVEQARQALKG